ncbi:MAG TPA: hypothetical protein VGN35_04995 [Jatrophihabitantaceae bacterium]|nr:hypothetical protein [Jatrophihabitantaceae bacterium]
MDLGTRLQTGSRGTLIVTPKGLVRMMWHDGWGAGNWFVMTLMMLLSFAFVAGLVVWAARGNRD